MNYFDKLSEKYKDRLRIRFQKYFIRGHDNECWNWVGCKSRKNYGRVIVKQRNSHAHRVSYFLHKGHPGDLLVCHTCDNRLCVNPNHLFLGTNQDNIDDRNRKGRACKKIPINYRRIIHEAIAEGFPIGHICRYFQVSRRAIAYVRNLPITAPVTEQKINELFL